VQQVAPRQHTGVCKQQRRDEQQQEDLGINVDVVNPGMNEATAPTTTRKIGRPMEVQRTRAPPMASDQQQHKSQFDDLHLSFPSPRIAAR
jgi:tRNA A37 N6-isopentenylltransferase MiaA